MDRYTRKDAEASFLALASALGKTVGHEPGSWELDYASEYGGYVITENIPGGGEGRPLGHRRRTASEFRSAVSFALDALYVARN